MCTSGTLTFSHHGPCWRARPLTLHAAQALVRLGALRRSGASSGWTCHGDDVEGLLVFALFGFVDDPSSWSSVARTIAPFRRNFIGPRTLGWTVHASWPFAFVTYCPHFVIAHLMAHWLGYTCGRLWLSVSEDRLLILDGDDARTPWGSAPLRCKLVRLCIGITSRTHWSLHPGASRVDGSGRVFAFLLKAALSTSTSRLRTTTRRWKGRAVSGLGLTTTTTD